MTIQESVHNNSPWVTGLLIVTGIGSVLSPIIVTWIQTRRLVRRYVGPTLAQVANSHEIDLRTDMDTKADKTDVAGLGRQIAALQRSVTDLSAQFSAAQTADEQFRRETYAELADQRRLGEKFHPEG